MHDAIYGISETLHSSVIPGFSFVVRILVPVPCCGMIIGKGGTNIKQMVDASGVSAVRLSSKDGGDPDCPFPAVPPSPTTAALVSATAERMVSITGPDLNSCLNCLHIILDGMTAHPDISRYANMTTSYSKAISATQSVFQGPQPPVTSTRRPDPGMDPFLGGQDDFSPAVHRSPSYGYLDRQSLTPSPHLGIPPSPTQARVDARSQFVPFGGGPFLPQEGPSRQPLQQMQNSLYLLPNSSSASFQSVPSANDSLRIPPSHSAPDMLALHMQHSLRVSDQLEGTNSTTATAGFGVSSLSHHQLPQPTHSPPGFVVQVAIPDNLIGSILGRGGRTLNELQVLSNTRIRISQRNEYVPGTKSRVVTIRGPTSQSVSTAQYLMNQRMVLPPSSSTYFERTEYGMLPYPSTTTMDDDGRGGATVAQEDADPAPS